MCLSRTLQPALQLEYVSPDASSEATLHIGVADGKPTAVSKLVRSPAALTGENEREIYEGDNLELSCAHPINDDWHVVWTHKEEEIPLEKMDISSEGVTRILKISLKCVYFLVMSKEFQECFCYRFRSLQLRFDKQ